MKNNFSNGTWHDVPADTAYIYVATRNGAATGAPTFEAEEAAGRPLYNRDDEADETTGRPLSKTSTTSKADEATGRPLTEVDEAIRRPLSHDLQV